MMAISVTKITIDTRELDRLTKAERRRASEIIRSTAFSVQGEAASSAPVDTSALANSIHTDVENDYLAVVADGVEYGIFQELGFHHWRSGQFIQNAFMIPAVEHHRPIFENAWGALFV